MNKRDLAEGRLGGPAEREPDRCVSLHIERLVLEGVQLGPGQAARVQAAVERELARLIATSGLNPGIVAGGTLASIGAGGIQLTGAVNGERLGGQIAAAVYSGLGV